MSTPWINRRGWPLWLGGHLLMLGMTPPGASGQSPVVVAEVVTREVVTGRQFVGTVDPLRTSSVGSSVNGRVVEYPVNEGDPVTRGQVLARLRTHTLEITLAGEQAQLSLYEHELMELRNGARREELDQARAAMLAARARMEFAQRDFDRVKQLHDQNSAARSEFDLATARAEETLQDYNAQVAAYNLTVEGPRPERIAGAEARVRAQAAEVERIEDLIDRHTMVAPFDGYIAAEHTELGEWVSESQTVAVVIDLSSVTVRVNVPEDSATHVRPGAVARVEIPALPDRTFEGVVSHIVPQAGVRSRAFPVLVQVTNVTDGGTPLLQAGMFAQVTLPVGANERATFVPKDAIVLGGAERIVYVVEEAPEGPTASVQPVAVQLGIADGEWIQVTGDVSAGQRVVVRGNERLRPGQPVEVAQTLEATIGHARPTTPRSSATP